MLVFDCSLIKLLKKENDIKGFKTRLVGHQAKSYNIERGGRCGRNQTTAGKDIKLEKDDINTDTTLNTQTRQLNI